MKFKGTGIIWNPKKDKLLVDFNKTEVFDTTSKEEQEILKEAKNCEAIKTAKKEDKE